MTKINQSTIIKILRIVLVIMCVGISFLPFADVFDPRSDTWVMIAMWNDSEIALILAPLIASIILALPQFNGILFWISSGISLVISGLYLCYALLMGFPAQDFIPRWVPFLMLFVFPLVAILKYQQYQVSQAKSIE